MVNMNKYKIKHTAIVFLLCAFAFSLKAQDNNEVLCINRTQIRFSLTPMLYDNLKLVHKGKKHLKSYPCFSGEGLISLYQPIINGFGLHIGAGFGTAPFNTHYRFSSPENSIFRTTDDKYDLDLNDFDYYAMYYVYPFYLSKNFKYKNKLYSVGLGIRYFTLLDEKYKMRLGSHYEIDEDKPSVQLFEFRLEDTGRDYFISYFVKFGLVKLTKKRNSFHFDLIMNYCPHKIGKGWYEFYDLPYESYGTVYQNINFIGFAFSYGLSL